MSDEILQQYENEYGSKPRTPNELIQFSKKKGTNLNYAEAKRLVNGNQETQKEKINTSQYAVGDQILMTKDRHAVIRFIGKVPELGDDNIWYGVELIDGTVGQNDGIVNGKRYFKTDGQRAMFIPPDKIRRIMTTKDHKRQNSYSELHSTVSMLKEQYQGVKSDTSSQTSKPDNNNNTAQKLDDHMENADSSSVVEFDPTANDHNENANNEQSIIERLKEAEENEEKNNQDNEDGNENKPSQQLKDQNSNHSRTPSIPNGNDGNIHGRKRSSQSQSQNQNQNQNQSQSQKRISQTKARQEVSTSIDFEFVQKDESILNYIRRQTNEEIRNLLYDIYCHPSTHPMINNAFNEIRNIKEHNIQKIVWISLCKRWQILLK